MTDTLEVQEEIPFEDSNYFTQEDESVIQGEVIRDETPNASIVIPVEVFQIIKSAPSGEKILSSCIDLAVFLSQKNEAYGDSALDPVRIFSKANPTEQILIRIDDKISRLMRGKEFGDDDTLRDLLGYLLLYFVSKSNTTEALPEE
jgi:hypothetical protein